MRRAWLWAAVALGAVVAGCGGSSNDSGSSCSPAGTWKTTGKVTNATTSLCATAAAEIGTQDTLTVAVNGTTITATSQLGPVYSGTLDTSHCSATLTATETTPIDSATTLNANSTVDATFQGSSLSGQQTVNVATTPVMAGTPCTITASITGTKQ